MASENHPDRPEATLGTDNWYQSTARTGGNEFADRCIRRLPSGSILNVGAGFSSGVTDLHSVTCVDLDPAVLKQGKSVAADVVALPFQAGTFDGALLKDVLEHVPVPVAALRELARVCRSDAVLTVTVPRAIPRAVWADPTHLRGFTSKALAWTLQMGGWEVLGRIGRVGSIPGAGRVPFLLENMEQILRVPGIGHWLGLNWIATARRR